jgi:hypothetical protein
LTEALAGALTGALTGADLAEDLAADFTAALGAGLATALLSVLPSRQWSGLGLSRLSPHRPATPADKADRRALRTWCMLYVDMYPRQPGSARPWRERRADCTQTKDCSSP